MTSLLPFFLCSAVSHDEKWWAIVPPQNPSSSSSTTTTTTTNNIYTKRRQSVQVYHVHASSMLSSSSSSASSTTTPLLCSLQTTLTYASECSLEEMVFATSSSHSKNSAGDHPHDNILIGRFGTSLLVLWDLDRGVVTHTLNANVDEEEAYLGIATASATSTQNNNVFHVLVRHGSSSSNPKLVVYEYETGKCKLMRKVKCGRWEGGGDGGDDCDPEGGDNTQKTTMTYLATSSTRAVVQTSPGILRVIDMPTGQKIGKIKAAAAAHGSSGGSLLNFSKFVLSEQQRGGKDQEDSTSSSSLLPILVTTSSSGTMSLYHLDVASSFNQALVHIHRNEEGDVHLAAGTGRITPKVPLQFLSLSSPLMNDEDYLLAGTEIYSIPRKVYSSKSPSKKNSGPSSSLLPKRIATLRSQHPMAPVWTTNNSTSSKTRGGSLMVMMYSRDLGMCRMRLVHPILESNEPSKMVILDVDQASEDQPRDSTENNNDNHNNNKRKQQQQSSSAPMILGPGQAGIEVASRPLKMAKTNTTTAKTDSSAAKASKDVEKMDELDNDTMDDKEDEDNTNDEFDPKELTIAERLKQLQQALDDDDEEEDEDEDAENDDDDDGDEEMKTKKKEMMAKFKPKQATTASLKELLAQALQSGDDAMLELALGVRDSQVIATTLRELHQDDMTNKKHKKGGALVTLLGTLTARLASNPLRAESLALWISHCLQQQQPSSRGGDDSTTSCFQPHHLAPLRHLLAERVESFADLLRLEGRLALVCRGD